MKIPKHHKLTIAIAIATAAILGSLHPAEAGSTKPNPAGLAKTAAAQLEACRVVQNEMNLFADKLAKGGEFTKQVDLAVYHKDTKRLLQLVRQAGVKRSKVTVEEMRADFFFRIRGCFGFGCFELSFGW